VKTGQQSKGGGDDNVGLDVPNHNVTYSGDGNDNDLDENRSNERGTGVCNDANNVGTFCDADNGDRDISDGIVNNIGHNDSNYVGNPPSSGDAVGERKKEVKTGQQSMGGGDNNVGVDGPNHDETNSGDGYDNVLDQNRNNEGGKVICNDDNAVGETCDGDNGDGDDRNGSVNNIGGNDSTDVVVPPGSGVAFGDGSDDSENSMNSSKDVVDDSQTLIGVNSLNFDDQINTGDGHDISHNKDK
jgi:hypothetical protein